MKAMLHKGLPTEAAGLGSKIKIQIAVIFALVLVMPLTAVVLRLREQAEWKAVQTVIEAKLGKGSSTSDMIAKMTNLGFNVSGPDALTSGENSYYARKEYSYLSFPTKVTGFVLFMTKEGKVTFVSTELEDGKNRVE
jgi:hypothetical protein